MAHAGKKAIIQIDVDGTPTPFGECRSYNLDRGRNAIDVSTLSDEWKKHLGGQKTWSGTLECFYDPADPAQAAMEELIEVDTPCKLTFMPLGDAAGSPVQSGDAIITSVGQPVETENAIGQSYGFTGTGPLTPSTVPVTP